MTVDLVRHRALLDLAGHFGFIVLSPDELNDMVAIAAAKRPERVSAVDEAVSLLGRFIEKLEQHAGGKLATPALRYLVKELCAEITLRESK